jgi:HPt (histidine-containing phosphotransfer) domain-containing protein
MTGPQADLHFLERLCKGDRRLMADFIRQYLQDSPALLRELARAAAAGDATALARAAHDLRPQAHYMGALRMEEGLIAADQGARKDPPVLRKDLVEEVVRWAAMLEAELHRILNAEHHGTGGNTGSWTASTTDL